MQLPDALRTESQLSTSAHEQRGQIPRVPGATIITKNTHIFSTMMVQCICCSIMTAAVPPISDLTYAPVRQRTGSGTGPAVSMVQQGYSVLITMEVLFMKRRLVAYLLISVLAATVFAGCGKKGGDAADAAATTEAAPAEEAEAPAEETEAPAEEAEAPAEEVEAPAEDAAPAEEAVEEVATEEGETEEAVVEEVGDTAATEAAAVEEPAAEEAEAGVTGEAAAAEEVEDVIVDPGTEYTVRFGGNIYASPDENDANIIDYVYPGYLLTINERLENYWYSVTYWIDGVARTGYIKIQ